MALVLQLIPILSMVFLITTATGSAMWACKIEAERQSEAPPDQTQSQAQSQVQSQAPPAYTEYVDNPV